MRLGLPVSQHRGIDLFFNGLQLVINRSLSARCPPFATQRWSNSGDLRCGPDLLFVCGPASLATRSCRTSSNHSPRNRPSVSGRPVGLCTRGSLADCPHSAPQRVQGHSRSDALVLNGSVYIVGCTYPVVNRGRNNKLSRRMHETDTGLLPFNVAQKRTTGGLAHQCCAPSTSLT
ncbi:uncharacterized protein BCR38DRAFT_210343 [Pseudomassariella vexata]|uniref:Uncharacterized protein n=1 Tax=Pseudomassariella vexata TaxID=1141098 RepID=A0A1Y2E050_9PEZI|nr:uncharacterized protein BCR38DRAFT_210343 [Pseudomassariella vexata]ORY64245.1 hypothetical protein BCR38DRAFT_210343 [Pseudomassariella vexata]